MDKALESDPQVENEGQFEIIRLQDLELDRHWDALCAELSEVEHLWADRWDLDHLLLASHAGIMQVWALGHAPKIEMVVITQIAAYPAARALQVILAIGEGVLKESMEMLDATLDRFAVLEGCSRIEIIGRDGWTKLLAPYGFQKRFVVLERPVKNLVVN